MSTKGLKYWYDENNYFILFFSLVLLILAPPFLYDYTFLSLLIYLFVTVVLINCFLVLFGHSKRPLRAITISVLILIFIWVDLLTRDEILILNLISNGLMAIIFGLTFTKIVRVIFSLPKVTGQVVIGAIAAYLLLGLMGAFLFDFIEILYPSSFSALSEYRGFYAEVYLSFVTISTLGYGDITPTTPQGQAAAIFVSITGQLYLAILMAMLVGKFLKDSDW